MRKRILGSIVALNLMLVGGLAVTTPAEAGFRDPCCQDDVDGNSFCDTCWFTHDCHSTADCGTIVLPT